MVTIRNVNENYGERVEFTGGSLDAAVSLMQDCIRECGPEFSNVVIESVDYEVVED